MSGCGCEGVHDTLMGYDAAVARLLAAAQPLQQYERLPLEAALGRILAVPVVSRIDVPGWDNSAMDGYALRAGDVANSETALPVSQRIAAGFAGVPLVPHTAARIFTGAPVPEGADTVVMQEDCLVDGSHLYVAKLPKIGANIRRRGEDIDAGDLILPAGTQLLPQHLGLAASVGVAELTVYRRLKVALLASGDELVMPGQPLGAGQIYNSNQFTAAGLLQSLGCEVVTFGMVADTLEATKAALQQAAQHVDLVLASGGVSVGEEDHVKPAVEQLGRLDMWKVAIRPGKPLAFGYIGDTPFFGTPGNPVSLFVTFLLFVRPYMRKMQGHLQHLPHPLQAIAAFDWPKASSRREFARAQLLLNAEGDSEVHIHASRSSAVLSSTVWANGLVIIPEESSPQRGDRVQFLHFDELLK
ncbi:MAG: molybdopterin molybdotransferase MoeA [Gammaproteobacteria bacterium]|nr:molybdopterin molybdotransferase MoeA [Gammaproteobacteria bacterium]